MRGVGRARSAGDRGSITPMILGLVVVSIGCAGLVLDGGRFIAERARLTTIAEEAARSGAEAVTDLRDAAWRLDPIPARARAEQYLTSVGAEGSVTVDATGVHVVVGGSVTPALLGLLGIGPRSIIVSRTALPVDH